MKKKNKEIVIKVIKSIFKIIITICIVYNVCYLLNTTLTQKEYLSVFGISFFNMKSNVMEPELKKNDLIITKENKAGFKKDDVIVYVANKQVKTSKIIEIETEDEQKTYITKANKNYYPENVKEGQIIGKLVFSVSKIGGIIQVLQTRISSIIIFIFLILLFVINRYSYYKGIERRRKKKQKINVYNKKSLWYNQTK